MIKLVHRKHAEREKGKQTAEKLHELQVSLAGVAGAAGVAAGNIQGLVDSFKENKASLEKARSKTLGSVDSSEYGVHFQSDQVIIFKGKVFSSSAVDNEIIYVVNPISISNVTLDGVSGTSGDVYFNRLYGVPSSVGTITISAPSAVKIITISITGTISVN